MIGVDRLDYSKGLTARFQAYSHLLETRQETRGRTVLIQIAPPSRSEVPEYQEIRKTLAAVAGQINSRYGEFDWTPLRYINKSFSHQILAGFFRASRIALVTSSRSCFLEFREGQRSAGGASGVPRATSEWSLRWTRPRSPFFAGTRKCGALAMSSMMAQNPWFRAGFYAWSLGLEASL